MNHYLIFILGMFFGIVLAGSVAGVVMAIKDNKDGVDADGVYGK